MSSNINTKLLNRIIDHLVYLKDTAVTITEEDNLDEEIDYVSNMITSNGNDATTYLPKWLVDYLNSFEVHENNQAINSLLNDVYINHIFNTSHAEFIQDNIEVIMESIIKHNYVVTKEKYYYIKVPEVSDYYYNKTENNKLSIVSDTYLANEDKTTEFTQNDIGEYFDEKIMPFLVLVPAE